MKIEARAASQSVEISEIAVPLRIVLVEPPPEVDFGIQDGKGNNYKTIAVQRSKPSKLTLECTISVKGNRADSSPNFVGSTAQNAAAESLGGFRYETLLPKALAALAASATKKSFQH